MIRRPCLRETQALAWCAVSVAALLGCDSTVNIRTVKLDLQVIYPTGYSFSSDLPPGSPEDFCDGSQPSVDLQFLMLANNPERVLQQIQDGDIVGNCVFQLGRGDDDNTCYLNDDTISIANALVQRRSKICTTDEECVASSGADWTCSKQDKLCEQPINLSVLTIQKEAPKLDVIYQPLGNPDPVENQGRIIAMLIDNSGSIRGDDSSGGLSTQPASDPRDERIAAAKTLLSNLDRERDRIGVFSLSGIDTDGVRFETEQLGGNKEGGGFYRGAEGYSLATKALTDMSNTEKDGTPLWAGIKIAAQAMRDNADLSKWSPSIIVFTDGYRKQDKEDVQASEEYGNLPSGVTFTDALDAVRSETDPIPVFIVHLENKQAVTTRLGRDPKLFELACSSGGAYYFMDEAEHTKGPYEQFFKFLTLGHYRMRLGYAGLGDDVKYPRGEDYAIKAAINVSMGGKTTTFDLEKGYIGTNGRIHDSRIFVTKP